MTTTATYRQVFALLRVSPLAVARAVLLGVITLSCAVGLAGASAWLIARASQHPGASALAIAAVGVRAAGVGRAVFRYTERLSSHDVALRGMVNLRTAIYRILSRQEGYRWLTWARGDLLARVGVDVDAVGDVVVRALIPSLIALFMSVGSVLLIGAFHVGAAVILAACLLLAGVVAPWLTATGTRRAEQRQAAARSELTALTQTVTDDAAGLRVLGLLNNTMAQVSAADKRLWQATATSARFAGLGTALGTLALGLAALGAIWLGVPDTLAGTLPPVELAVVVLTPLAAFEATSVLPMAAIQLQRSRAAGCRIANLLTPALPPPSQATVTLGDGSLESHKLACGWTTPVVTGFDLSLIPGRLVALVGPSGIGKTTIAATLAGLIPPLSGDLHIPAHAGEPAVMFTSEDAHIFQTTVAENLRVATADVPNPHQLLEQVGLSDWLESLPAGLETILGSGGYTVSGGERRRLLLARALASPAQYWIIDEGVEHLDPQSADEIVTLLSHIAHEDNRAIMLITHRLAALEVADEVILLGDLNADGKAAVVARGSHLELLRDNSVYRGANQEGES